MLRSMSSSRSENRTVVAPGFYDGDGLYRARFMPDAEGEWTYRTRSNVAALNDLTGAFRCGPPSAGNSRPCSGAQPVAFRLCGRNALLPLRHDLLRVDSPTAGYAAPDARHDAGLRASTNCAWRSFPKHYTFNENEPLHDIYERKKDGALDFDRPNVIAFRHFETQVAALGVMGVEADVIIFHPYDRWGYCTMSAEQDDRYVRYLVARLGAYRNVWWSLANEYDFLIDVKPVARWDRFFHIIEENDPARHLKSIHNGEETMNFDHRKPWVDHVCIQNWNVKRTTAWRNDWGKPIVNDELEYEGDISLAWGNISPQELVHRFWVTVIRGGYAGHGETYAHPQDLLWWAKGGVASRGELETNSLPAVHH